MTDKLVDALEDAKITKDYGSYGTMTNVSVFPWDMNGMEMEDLAAWLRSPVGIAALAEDETIGEAVARRYNELWIAAHTDGEDMSEDIATRVPYHSGKQGWKGSLGDFDRLLEENPGMTVDDD